MTSRHQATLALLRARSGWHTAAEIAERLGVTPRSVRNYVARINQEAGAEVVRSGPQGYRLDADNYRRLRSDSAPQETDSPTARASRILRELLDAQDGVDLYELADRFHVSESTIEADLVRLRGRLVDTGLGATRRGATVLLVGSEGSRRRALVTMLRDSLSGDVADLSAVEALFPGVDLGGFKTALIAALEEQGATINDYGLSDVVFHAAVAAERTARHRPLALGDEAPALASGLSPAALSRIVAEHLGVELGAGDLSHLDHLLATRVATPVLAGVSERDSALAAVDRESIRRIVVDAGREFFLELDDENFLSRLALHVRNLVARAQDQSFSRNPLTSSIKAGYPLLYELAVHIARQLQRVHDVTVNDDEIAYIAMHVGAQVEQRRKSEDDIVPITVVAPSYLDLPQVILGKITAALGDEIAVVELLTRSDVVWDALPGDVVVSIVPPAVPDPRVVVISAFPTSADIEAVRSAIAGVRRSRRRATLMTALSSYFDRDLFFRDIPDRPAEDTIRFLGQALQSEGIIGQDYLDGMLERERMSSTAFTDALAVPHAMVMSAERTAIAVVLNESPLDWNGSRVNMVACIAFSETDGPQFRATFDQFVETFSERDALRRLLESGTDFDSFLETLVELIGS